MPPVKKPAAAAPEPVMKPARQLAAMYTNGNVAAIIRFEQTDETFPRSIKPGGRTSPRLYHAQAMDDWFRARAQDAQPYVLGPRDPDRPLPTHLRKPPKRSRKKLTTSR